MNPIINKVMIKVKISACRHGIQNAVQPEKDGQQNGKSYSSANFGIKQDEDIFIHLNSRLHRFDYTVFLGKFCVKRNPNR